MTRVVRSTLSEVNNKVGQVCYEVLTLFDDQRWKDPQQLIYSTVPGWETSYEASLVARKIDNVKFPFAALTRDTTQETQKLWNKSLTAHEPLQEGVSTVKSVKIKPVRVTYILAIYDQRLEDIEAIADMFMSQGHETQRLDYYSNVLEQEDRVSFVFNEPQHEMIPDKAEKRKGGGFVYGLYIPITVDCVLGVKAEEKLIERAVSNVLLRIEDPLPDDIQDIPETETEIIDDENC